MGFSEESHFFGRKSIVVFGDSERFLEVFFGRKSFTSEINIGTFRCGPHNNPRWTFPFAMATEGRPFCHEARFHHAKRARERPSPSRQPEKQGQHREGGEKDIIPTSTHTPVERRDTFRTEGGILFITKTLYRGLLGPPFDLVSLPARTLWFLYGPRGP